MNYKLRDFRKERVILDGHAFTDCTFTGCDLVFLGVQLPVLTGCAVYECAFVFEGYAGNALSLMRSLHQAGSGFREAVEETLESIRL